MTRKYSNLDITIALCYRTMDTHNMGYQQRLDWEIYGARHQACSTCGARANMPCANMSDVKYNSTRSSRDRRKVRVNKRPHPDRIDWNRIYEGLKKRGYWRQAIETQTRRAMHEDFDGTEEELTETRPMPDWAK